MVESCGKISSGEAAMQIVFMGTPEFAIPTLEHLILSEHQVVAVYTQPDRVAGRGRALTFSPNKGVALEHGLTVVQPTALRRVEEVERLIGFHPDLIVVAAFGQILPPQVLAIPPHGCINVHPSLLPRHRGPSPVAAAILAGDEFTGVTIMLMDSGVDTGPILAQTQVVISPEDTTGSLTSRLAQVGARLLGETLPRWLGGDTLPQAQDDGKASYSKPIAKGEGEIAWPLPATEIWRRVRAFQPWPVCYTWWGGKLLKIKEAEPLAWKGAMEPGRVIALPGATAVGVQTGEGVLGLLRLQLEGKREMAAAEFLRGQRGFIRALLPLR